MSSTGVWGTSVACGHILESLCGLSLVQPQEISCGGIKASPLCCASIPLLSSYHIILLYAGYHPIILSYAARGYGFIKQITYYQVTYYQIEVSFQSLSCALLRCRRIMITASCSFLASTLLHSGAYGAIRVVIMASVNLG